MPNIQKNLNVRSLSPDKQSSSSSSRMRVIYHNWSATKQRPHPQSVAEISHHMDVKFISMATLLFAHLCGKFL